MRLCNFQHHLVGSVAAAFILTGLAGCGGGSSNAPAQSTPVSQQPTATPPTSPTSPAPPASAASGLFLWAGNTGGRGTINAPVAADARFDVPTGIAADGQGNLYVTDALTVLRKIDRQGTVTTLAGKYDDHGTTDGPAAFARFTGLAGAAADAQGNIYLFDHGVIRKRATDGTVSTLAGQPGVAGSADGTGASAQFGAAYYGPLGIAVDANSNLFVADYANHAIRKVTSNGVVTTIAGKPGEAGSNDGTGSAARFTYPSGIAVDAAGNLYVADTTNSTIRKITPAGVVSTLAGKAGVSGMADGKGEVALFAGPSGIAVDAAGAVYVADSSNYAIRKVLPDGTVTTLAGMKGPNGVDDGAGIEDGTGQNARFRYPYGMTFGADGALYVADQGNATIRRVTLDGTVTTFAGKAAARGCRNGTGSDALFDGGKVASAGYGTAYVAGCYSIRKIAADGTVTMFAGRLGEMGIADGSGDAARFMQPLFMRADRQGNLYVVDFYQQAIRKVTPGGVVTTLVANAAAGVPGFSPVVKALGIDGAGNVYVLVQKSEAVLVGLSGSYAPAGVLIRKVAPDGTMTSVAPDALSPWKQIFAMEVDRDGNIYFSPGDATIRKLLPTGETVTLAGKAGEVGSIDGTSSEARLQAFAVAMAVDNAGNLFAAYGDTVRKIAPNGVVTTIGGQAGAVPVGRLGQYRLGDLPGIIAGIEDIALVGDSMLAISTGSAVLRLVLP